MGKQHVDFMKVLAAGLRANSRRLAEREDVAAAEAHDKIGAVDSSPIALRVMPCIGLVGCEHAIERLECRALACEEGGRIIAEAAFVGRQRA